MCGERVMEETRVKIFTKGNWMMTARLSSTYTNMQQLVLHCSKSHAITRIYGKLSIALVEANARALLTRCNDGPGNEFLVLVFTFMYIVGWRQRHLGVWVGAEANFAHRFQIHCQKNSHLLSDAFCNVPYFNHRHLWVPYNHSLLVDPPPPPGTQSKSIAITFILVTKGAIHFKPASQHHEKEQTSAFHSLHRPGQSRPPPPPPSPLNSLHVKKPLASHYISPVYNRN